MLVRVSVPSHFAGCVVVSAVLLFLALARPARAEFVIGSNFTSSRSDQTTLNPPDTMGAVGAEHVVELINGRFAVYDKSEGSLLVGESLDQFWTDAGVPPTDYAFDPRVLYDPHSERWFAVSVDNKATQNHLLFAVSSSADPTAPWSGFKIDSDPGDGAQWADFPTLGINRDGLFVVADMINIGSDSKSSVNTVVFPKTDLLLDVPTVANRTLIDNRNDIGFALQPAVDMDSSGLPLAVLSTTGGVDWYFFVSEIGGTVNTPSLSAVGYPTMDSLIRPPVSASQPVIGGIPKADIHTGPSRFSSNVIVQNGSIWAVLAMKNDDLAAVRWLEIRQSDSEILQSGLIEDDELALYYPSIAVNDFGEVVIGFSGSSESQPVSAYAVMGTTDEGMTEFGDITLLKAGVDDYERLDSKNRNRWGDYSATVVDPEDPHSFWTFQQFVSGDNEWAIQVTQVTAVPEPSSLFLALAGVVATLAGSRRRHRHARAC